MIGGSVWGFHGFLDTDKEKTAVFGEEGDEKE